MRRWSIVGVIAAAAAAGLAATVFFGALPLLGIRDKPVNRDAALLQANKVTQCTHITRLPPDKSVGLASHARCTIVIDDQPATVEFRWWANNKSTLAYTNLPSKPMAVVAFLVAPMSGAPWQAYSADVSSDVQYKIANLIAPQLNAIAWDYESHDVN